MKKLKDRCDLRRAAVLALMLVSPMAIASDFRGFITIFLGFPSIIFCNLVPATLLFGFYLGARKFGLLVLIPLYGVALLLALCVASVSGMFVLQGPGSTGGWQSIVMFLAMATSFVASLFAVFFLFRTHSREEGQWRRRKTASWSAFVLAVATSFSVGFDFRTLMEKGGPDWSLVACYSILLGIVLILHALVVRLPSRG